MNRPSELRGVALDPESNEALVEKYGAIGYAAQSNALSHPDRLATAAALFGLAPPSVATARVLEIGCSDGANLLPMAAGLPDATFVGCDLSPEAIAIARGAVAATRLENIAFIEGDLCALPEALDRFDFVIAHGVYSWVPAPVRDALLALGAKCLSPNGLMFVSYNVYPGCHVRRAVWDALRFHVRNLETARERLDAARSLASGLAQPGRTQNETDALLRREFARVAAVTDSALFHDDLALPNEPVWFHEFAAHARSRGLAYVTEAKLFQSSALGLAPAMHAFLAGADRVEREQYLDFAVCRRFRQSVLARAEGASVLAWTPERALTMHAAASHSLLRAVEKNTPLLNPTRPALDAAHAATLRRVLDRLLEIAPRSLPVTDLQARFGGSMSAPSFAATIADACVADELLLHVHPPRLSETPGERPLASAVARWQAARGATVTNLEHEPLQIVETPPRALLSLLDGKRDAPALDAAVGPALAIDEPAARRRRIDQYVRQFARLGLLIA